MQLLSQTSKTSSLDSCARDILDATPSLLWYIRRHMRKHRQHLSIPQFRALFKVGDVPGASLSCVAEHLGASLPTASRIVDVLVDKGYLTRTSCDEDRRQVKLHLTRSGRAVRDAAQAATIKEMETQLARLSAVDRTQVSQAMVTLKNLFESLGYPGAAANKPAQEMAGPAGARANGRMKAAPRRKQTV